MNITIQVPKNMCNLARHGESLPMLTRRLALEALDDGLTPEPTPSVDRVPVSVHLGSDIAARLADGKTPMSQRVSTLAYAAAMRQMRDAKVSAETAPAGQQWQWRPDQVRCYNAWRPQLESGGILIAEASTGIGKGRLIAQLANDFHNQGPVIVTAPSLQVISELLKEYLQIPDRVTPNIVIGRGQFVDTVALWDWLHQADDQGILHRDQPQYREVLDWVLAGGPACGEATAILHQSIPDLRWLVEDLAAAAPDFTLIPSFLLPSEEKTDDAVTLADAEADDLVASSEITADIPLPDMIRAQVVYKRLRAQAMQAKVLFCTHTMVAIDEMLAHKHRTRILPTYKTLLIDEAHLFEEKVAEVHSRALSFKRLGETLRLYNHVWKARRLSTAAKAAARATKIAEDAIRQVAPRHKQQIRVSPDPSDPFWQCLEAVLPNLGHALEPFREKGLPDSGPFGEIHEAIEICEQFRKGEHELTFRFSPVHRCPSVQMGPRSVSKSLQAIWQGVHRAALVSATLYIPSLTGEPLASYMRVVMSIPEERVRTTQPAVATWLYDPVLHLPGASSLAALTPPQESDFASKSHKKSEEQRRLFQAARAAWQHNVADIIAEKVAPHARGGTLVLLPSFEDLEGIVSALPASLKHRLLVQQRGGLSVSRAKHAFIARAQAGIRPIWFATGPAWAGLDIRADAQQLAPAQDFLLTDLVIPRVPFGINQSTTHRHRAARMQTAERNEAAFRMKQGLGRLMRRGELTDRHLWVLDARILDPSKAWLVGAIREMLLMYPKREAIHLGDL